MKSPPLKAQHSRPQLEVWLTTFGNTSQHSIQMEEQGHACAVPECNGYLPSKASDCDPFRRFCCHVSTLLANAVSSPLNNSMTSVSHIGQPRGRTRPTQTVLLSLL